jgi:alkaline phosphatase
MKLSRREVIGKGGLAAAGLTLGITSPLKALSRRGERAKNVIFCVVDGMPIQVMAMVDHFQQIRDGKRSYWSTLLDEPFVTNGLQDTRSLNSVVTDSSAASSAWGSGRRIWNGQLNMYPDGTELKTLFQLVQDKGVRTGLVTTTRMTHATPAGFAVSCESRNLEGLIAEKYLSMNINVLMGGGDRFFSADRRQDKKDLYGGYRQAGYTVVNSKAELNAARGKLLGIFDDTHLPYTIDRINSTELSAKVPTLAEMTSKALSLLKDSSDGFLLQVEGGRVDHGGHSTDLAAMIYDQIEFEDALKVVVDFALEDEETLVIITADHACGGPSLNGAGSNYDDSTAGLESVVRMKASYDVIFAEIGRTPSANQVKDAIKKHLGIELKNDEAEAVSRAADNDSPFKLGSFATGLYTTLAMVLGNYTKVVFTSGNHTNEHVLVTSLGPHSEMCAGLTENTTFFDLMLASYGIEHKNPVMSYEDAKKHRGGRIDDETMRLYCNLDPIDLAH